MRGHIVKRGANSYSLVVPVGKGPDGKRKQHWESVKGTRKDAEKRLGELIHQLDAGVFVKPGKATLKEHIEAWLEDSAKPNLSPRSYEGYQYIARKYIVPALGQVPLSQLKPQHLQSLYAKLLTSGRTDGKGGLSNRSVQYVHTTLHKCLDVAVKMGVLGRNVADAVECPKPKHHEIQTMSESDIHLFLDAARDTPYHALFYLALFSGMRRSELLALQWGDVDLLLCQLSVNRALHQLHTREIITREPKTAKSRRLIALSPSTVSVLREHHAKQEALRQQLGLPPARDTDYVFSSYDGKPLLPDSVSQAWRHLARRTGLKVRMHDSRHSHATLMLKQGVHPKIVQERLGHASITTTLNIYSHVTPGLQEAAANRFDDILMPETSESVTESIG